MQILQQISNNVKVSQIVTKNDVSDTEKKIQLEKSQEENQMYIAKNDIKEFFDIEDVLTLSEMRFSSVELDQSIVTPLDSFIEDAGKLDFEFQDSEPFYLFDFSIPAESNTDALALMFGDFKIDPIKNTRIPLSIASTGLSLAIVASLLSLPSPFNVASAIALGGPLFVSVYGLITQKN